jgi:hypothetical protein
MKQNQPQTMQHDPWNDLTQNDALTNVPLEQVLRSLRVSQGEATAVKDGLLRQVTRLCQDQPARKK